MTNSFFLLLLLISLEITFSASQLIRLDAKKGEKPKSRLRSYSTRQMGIDANVTLLNYLNDQYMSTVYLGSNLQPFNLLIDTGSAWLWVGQPESAFTHTYDCAASTTCIENRSDVHQLKYGQGMGFGFATDDTLTIGDGFVVSNQTFLVVSGIQDMGIFFGDGIMGLGNSALSGGHPTFIDNLYERGLISSKCFSIYIGNDPTSYGGQAGTFIIGGYDPYFMVSEFTYLDVTDSNYWAVDLVGISLGNQALALDPLSNPKAVIDSGTSLITFPKILLKRFYDVLSQTAVCSLDSMIICDCSGSFPDLVITLDGLETIIPSSMYVSETPNYCQILIQSLDYHNYIILGDVFMRQYYTFFSGQNNTIGFAVARPFEPSHVVRTLFIILIIFICVLLILTSLRRHYLSYKERKYGNPEFTQELASVYVPITPNTLINPLK